MTPNTPNPTPAPAERREDRRYARGLNAFCVRCQQDKSRAGGVQRGSMFLCSACTAPKS